jgi:aminoacyl tRNA synthase complex-interacting multifunctional protein 1
VGRVAAAEPLANSEKLLKCSVEVGGGEVRQVVAGLQQYVAADALRGSLVCVILNLKPAKLAGEKSEAMILAADTPAPGGGVIVRMLQPPGARPRPPPSSPSRRLACRRTARLPAAPRA